MSEREDMTRVAERLEEAGISVRGWWWMEQGGPYLTEGRVPKGVQGEQAEPVVSGADVLNLLGRRGGVSDKPVKRFLVFQGEPQQVADRLTLYQDVGAFMVDANGHPVMKMAVGPNGNLVVLAMVHEEAG